MSALVIYESMYGNTKAIAEAIAEGLAAGAPVRVIEVSHAPTSVDDDITLLVAGGPTHAFGMSRVRTRQDAARRQTPLVSPTMGVREWLAALDRPRHGLQAATFDTRTKRPHLPGSAARAIRRRLRRKGFAPFETSSFWVDGATGPLADGELDRARRWGRRLAELVAGPAATAA